MLYSCTQIFSDPTFLMTFNGAAIMFILIIILLILTLTEMFVGIHLVEMFSRMNNYLFNSAVQYFLFVSCKYFLVIMYEPFKDG